jgi:predicted DCC family thiol-disulfide oxidoreductase YuxK
MTHLPPNKKIILFDGICNLCNNFVLKVIRYDKKNNFVFCASQSEAGKKILKDLQVDMVKLDAIILYAPGISYEIKSNAAIKIMNDFGGLWNLTQIFWLFPEGLRNYVYNFIAKNRYQWFGKKEHCMRPTAALKARFLE